MFADFSTSYGVTFVVAYLVTLGPWQKFRGRLMSGAVYFVALQLNIYLNKLRF